MELVIDNVRFELNSLSLGVLKLKHTICPEYLLSVKDKFDEATPITVKEAISQLSNLEQRRVALKLFSVDQIVRDIKSKEVSRTTLSKKYLWEDDSKGSHYEDTYILYSLDSGDLLSESRSPRTSSLYYLTFKDTSTDRNYLLWVDSSIFIGRTPDPIDAIAWSIQTTVPYNHVKAVIRQGDCILVETDPNVKLLSNPRHLTKEEYLTLLKLES